MQRSIYPVKTRGLICVCLQSPAPTPLGAGRAHPQGLLPALCPSLGMFGELALPAGWPCSCPPGSAAVKSSQLCCPEQPPLRAEVPPPRRTAQGVRLQPKCSTALSGKQPGSFLIKQPGEFRQSGSAGGCATSSTAAAEAGMPEHEQQWLRLALPLVLYHSLGTSALLKGVGKARTYRPHAPRGCLVWCKSRLQIWAFKQICRLWPTISATYRKHILSGLYPNSCS